MATASTHSPEHLSRPTTWRAVLSSADSATRDLPDAGLTTLVALCVTDDLVCGAASGDSAAVLLNADDRYYELTSEQDKDPPVGSGEARFVAFSEPLVKPSSVVLMSDGVWKAVGWRRVQDLTTHHRGRSLLDAFVDAAKSAGGGVLGDDLTVVVVDDEGCADA